MARRPQPWLRSDRGLWYVQLDGRQHNLGSNEEEAFRQFHEMLARPKEAPVPGTAILVMDDFLTWCKKHRASRTYDWYFERIQQFAKHIGTLPLAQLKAFHLQEFLDKHEWSDSHKRGVIIAIQRAFRWAYKLGRIEKFPLKGIEKPPAGKREQIVTPEQFADLLRHVKDEPFRDLLTAVWEVGCRPQEIVRVESRHVDLQNKRWMIPASEAKGKKRIRIVYLTPAALEITQRLKLKNPTGPLFRNTDGVAWHPWAVNCRFTRLKPKIGRKIALYDLRHSYCHRALKNGVDPITLANLMGHVDTAMIARVYSHISQDQTFMHEQALKAIRA